MKSEVRDPNLAEAEQGQRKAKREIRQIRERDPTGSSTFAANSFRAPHSAFRISHD